MKQLWVFIETQRFYDIQNKEPGFELGVTKK